MNQISNVEVIETFQGDDEQWYYHGKAGNGEILFTSEGYTRHEDAVRGAESAFPDTPITASTTFNEPSEGGEEMSEEQQQPQEGEEAAQGGDEAAEEGADQEQEGEAQQGDENA